jgi:FkbM family methyltransferase
MPDNTTITQPGLRQRIAALTPGPLRKAVRMAEHYRNRLHSWRDVRREFEPVDARSAEVLQRSWQRSPISALAQLDSFQPPRLLDNVVVRVAGAGQFELRANTDDVLHVLTAREPEVRGLLEQHLQTGGTFVDAGANIGFYSVLAARLVGPQGTVFAFEMMPDTAAILRRHVALNDCQQVTIVERALSARSGETVNASVEPGKHGQASIVTDSEATARVAIAVETVTLDDALVGVGRIDLLKMDLEGAEYLALCGATRVLARTDCVVFESNDEDVRVFDLFAGHGFAIRRLAGFDFVAERPIAENAG